MSWWAQHGRVFKKTSGRVFAGYTDSTPCSAATVAFNKEYPMLSEDGKGLETYLLKLTPSVYEHDDDDLAFGVVVDVQFSNVRETDDEGRAFATVVVTFANERFCEHVKEGDRWEGR